MEYTAKAIAEYLNGKVEGDPDVLINDVSKIENGKEGSLTFLANPKYSKYIYTTKASVVLVNKDFIPESEISCTLIKVDNAYNALASLLELYKGKKEKKGVDKKAFLHKTAKTGKDVYIGPFACISQNAKIGDNVKVFSNVFVGDNVEIGDNTTIFPGVNIYEDSKIGKNCSIHAGVIIGADGFGFAPQKDCDYKKVPQVGNVIIEDNVEIGANTTIDRATIGSTIIRKGVKLDNLIQIAHNVEIGENTVIAAQAGIAGSTKIGRDCMIAAQAGIVGHLNISDNVKVGAQSGVTSDIEKDGIVLGSPAYGISEARRIFAVSKKLPELYKRVNDLERQLKNLNSDK